MDHIITKAELEACPWKDILSEADEELSDYFHAAFSARFNDYKGTDHEGAVHLLMHIASMMLQRDDDGAPHLGPIWIGPKGRSFLPEDLSEEQALALHEFLPSVDIPEFKARIADTLWTAKVHKDKHLAAIEAAKSYVESGILLAKKHQFGFPKRFARATTIALQLGKGAADEYKAAIAAIEEALDDYKSQEPSATQIQLLQEMLKRREGDVGKYIAYCDGMAEQAEKDKHIHLARDFWELHAKWCVRASNEECEKYARKRIAETYLTEASMAGNAIVEAKALQSAIECLRQLGQETEELHKRLLSVQKKAVGEMQTHESEPIDISEIVSRSIAQVAGKNIRDALVALAIITHPEDPTRLRAQVEELASKYPLSRIVGATHMTGKGKTAATTPAIGDDEDANETATLHDMHKHFGIHVGLAVQGGIRPALDQFNKEHAIQVGDLFHIVSNNPFIPEGREIIFARGLKAGFDGDYLVACHLLIPQIENCFRHVVERGEGITSSLNSNGTQREQGLDVMLEKDVVKQQFAPATLFALKTLLIEQTGSNLRHETCHGLLHQQAFYSDPAIYTWWLVLRICCLPLINHATQEQETAEPATSIEKNGEDG
ncbi:MULTISPECIES: DUF4209 domain-containing protein [unclassified Pseudodesulfovibrio]|uniref:DUF4209 domain-containing protein n=1 Tax=unclassified Pseudodesulfovibrio TaxID=2661612 RepID=UPI000FEBF501|nr:MULTISPECIES: DUF4209 domain-containing protein [unclassified Pseudodesulfovibrio]MCJ2165237.1 DUF4209 domain-containing protein [Pseudodesulfovibrio sp. S3-i]RWU03291.1 DUF4209 domain-containing protein [Pseudodesulfovibrio sp. S3]